MKKACTVIQTIQHSAGILRSVCSAKNENRLICHAAVFVQPVFMVKPAEYRKGHNVVVVWNVVPLGLEFDPSESKLRNSWPEVRVWTSSVVMSRPFFQDSMDLRFV